MLRMTGALVLVGVTIATQAFAVDAPAEIKIGTLYASSGRYASISMPVYSALKLWADQKIDLVLRDKLVVQRRRGRGVALIVIGHKLDGNFLVERLHIGTAFGIFLVGPELECAENRHRNRGVATG